MVLTEDAQAIESLITGIVFMVFLFAVAIWAIGVCVSLVVGIFHRRRKYASPGTVTHVGSDYLL